MRHCVGADYWAVEFLTSVRRSTPPSTGIASFETNVPLISISLQAPLPTAFCLETSALPPLPLYHFLGCRGTPWRRVQPPATPLGMVAEHPPPQLPRPSPTHLHPHRHPSRPREDRRRAALHHFFYQMKRGYVGWRGRKHWGRENMACVVAGKKLFSTWGGRTGEAELFPVGRGGWFRLFPAAEYTHAAIC